jgi:hypothetical protein
MEATLLMTRKTPVPCRGNSRSMIQKPAIFVVMSRGSIICAEYLDLVGKYRVLKRTLLSELDKAETRQYNVHKRSHKIWSLDEGDGILRLKPFI